MAAIMTGEGIDTGTGTTRTVSAKGREEKQAGQQPQREQRGRETTEISDGLDSSIMRDIVACLSQRDSGGSASDLSKSLNRNRLTVSKYLEVMQSQGVVTSKKVAQARLWELSSDYLRPKVMIVDDDKYILDLVKLSLIHKNFELIEARDGVEALEKVRVQKPDLLILDLMMPKLDGREVCSMIRKSPATEDIPIIMLTAKTQVLDKVEGFRLGADDYVTKPFNPLELEARVDALLQRQSRSMKLNSVTGLPGYDPLMEKLAETKAKIIVIDINHFRTYNAQHGFQKGNDLLRVISRIMKMTVRSHGSPEDFIAHIASDDFVILTYENAEQLSHRIREALDEHLKTIFPGDVVNFSFATVDSLDVVDEIKNNDVMSIFNKITRS